jgi:hypothetical protein
MNVAYPRFRYTGTPDTVFRSILVDADTFVEVVGQDGFAAYEWILRRGSSVLEHSDCGYGDATIALRDGLINYDPHGAAEEVRASALRQSRRMAREAFA